MYKILLMRLAIFFALCFGKSLCLTATEIMDNWGMRMDEAQDRLGHLYDKINVNKNGFITVQDIENWIVLMNQAGSAYFAMGEIESIDKNGDGLVQWEELSEALDEVSDTSKSETDTDDESGESGDGKPLGESMQERGKRMLQKRFDAADVNGDNSLDAAEFSTVLNPGLSVSMSMIEAHEVLSTQDTDKDDKISFEEFFAINAYQENMQHDSHMMDEDKEQISEEFKEYDLNNDGFIDFSEILEALKEPRASVILEAKKTFEELGPNVSRDVFVQSVSQLLPSVITDKGEILRHPLNYLFSDGHLPYAAVSEPSDLSEQPELSEASEVPEVQEDEEL